MVVRNDSVWVNKKTSNLYKVIGTAKHSETEESLVVYKAVNKHQLWVRPYELFLEKFEWCHD